MRHRALAFALSALPAVALAASPYPPTERRPVTDVVHGEDLVDSYRWLEGDNSDPARMGTLTPEIDAWTDAQNAYTRSVLDAVPGRKAVEARLTELMQVGGVSAPAMRANRYFYSKREGTQNQARVYVRDGYKGEPKLLLDPEALDASGLVTVAWYRPSADGKLLAYGTYRAGDENAKLNLLDVDTLEKLPTEVPNKVSGVSWLPDGSGFVYRNLADAANPYSGQVKFHKVGRDLSKDETLLRQFTKEEDEKLATTYGPNGGISDDGKWLIFSYATGTRENDLWVAPAEPFFKSGKVERRDVLIGKDASAGGEVVGDTMFMQTSYGAPNGRVIAVNLNHPEESAWTVVVPERKDATIQGVSIAKGIMAVNYLKNASSTIELFDHAGKALANLKLPGIGSAGLSTEQDRTEAYLTFTSFNYPSSIFRVDLAKPDATPELWERPAVPVDPDSVEVKQEWYSSKDGTKVSMFIVHRKGVKPDGNNPTILYGYGGFNISQTPAFSAPMFQWYESGGVLAVANLRGGGEYGEAWHKSGQLEKKQNTHDDFIAAAEYLIRAGYTNPKRLAIRGGSQGGLLTGAFLTQRPDLVAAVLCAVPLLDMVRYQDFLMARYWVPEYGSSEDEAQFAFIRKYSPYQNVKKGTAYPAVLFTAGERDARVHPMHARKMAAAVREATSSDPVAMPILFWADRDSGHGQGKPLNLRVRDAADERMFFMWQLGMLPKK